MIIPKTASQWLPWLSIKIKVSELTIAIKNRDNLTVPNENLALRPPAISDDSTIDPQPPPPTASIKPPPKPSKDIRLIFLSALLCFPLKAFLKITIPNIRVYKDTAGLVYKL